jgi:hypothetical protein
VHAVDVGGVISNFGDPLSRSNRVAPGFLGGA